jgi:hypothetical protein
MTTHILNGGWPLCGEPQGVPLNWPDGHSWISIADAREDPSPATCVECIGRLRRLDEARAAVGGARQAARTTGGN